MTQRQQSIGIFCWVAAAAVLGGVGAFVLSPGSDPASRKVVLAAAPPVPTVGNDEDMSVAKRS